MTEKVQPMPKWLDGSHIDPEWFEAVTGIHCDSCYATDISNETRKSQSDAKDGATLRLKLETKEGNDQNLPSLIIKQVTEEGLALAKSLGLAREGLFYRHLSSEMPQHLIPRIYYSYGDFATGTKIVIMEDIHDAIDSGVLFGPGNPNNWKRDIEAISSRAGSPSPSSKQVTLVTFREMARVHAIYWKCGDLLSTDKTWLRGQEWLRGQGRASWEASQKLIQSMWKDYLVSEADRPVVSWNKTVRATLEKVIAGISWESQLDRLHPEGNWTLVHGDFWPGNVMWKTTRQDSIKIIDWEMVGIGSGPQELGQYIISNMDPKERKECEREVVRAYYDELKSNQQGDLCSWDYCWQEYRIGGVERWLWFLVYFVGSGMDDWAQFFHDQIAAFMTDHELTPNDFTQPRP
eukprot:scaffold405_cov132-Cylindrotheca_fusiformis.AAC.24